MDYTLMYWVQGNKNFKSKVVNLKVAQRSMSIMNFKYNNRQLMIREEIENLIIV